MSPGKHKSTSRDEARYQHK
ncbi:hypothetical protein CEXT_507441, partial [Caerostris extrusa]